MSRLRWSAGLAVTFGLVAAGPAAALPPVVKLQQRAAAGANADALLRAGRFADAVGPAAECLRLTKDWTVTRDSGHPTTPTGGNG